MSNLQQVRDAVWEALHTCVMDEDARHLLRQALHLMRRKQSHAMGRRKAAIHPKAVADAFSRLNRRKDLVPVRGKVQPQHGDRDRSPHAAKEEAREKRRWRAAKGEQSRSAAPAKAAHNEA
jgi:hypothetical protein